MIVLTNIKQQHRKQKISEKKDIRANDTVERQLEKYLRSKLRRKHTQYDVKECWQRQVYGDGKGKEIGQGQERGAVGERKEWEGSIPVLLGLRRQLGDDGCSVNITNNAKNHQNIANTYPRPIFDTKKLRKTQVHGGKIPLHKEGINVTTKG